jgi:D-alanyl-D-alanine carboxypeptidase
MLNRIIRLIVIFSFASNSFALNVSSGAAPDVDERVDVYIRQQMSKHRIPGLSVAVLKSGRILKLKGFGLASVEFDVPADENTIFQLFSVSKIFAGVAVLKLIEENSLTLDSSITDFIENSPPEWKAIRIRHLLTHTSGMPEMSANPRFACLPEDKKKRITAAEQIAFLSELPLKFQPGERFSYHLSGYHLLGFIVERVAKQTYSEFLQQRVFGPYSMTSTRFGGTEAAVIKRRSSTSYSLETGQLNGWIYPFSIRDYPAAGLNSSARDLAKFLVALESDKLLKKEQLEIMWAPVRFNDGTQKGYGLGWTVDNHAGRKVVGHEGGGAIWLAHFPAEHLSIVVLCNLNGARADEIQYGIADFYLQQ